MKEKSKMYKKSLEFHVLQIEFFFLKDCWCNITAKYESADSKSRFCESESSKIHKDDVFPFYTSGWIYMAFFL